MKALSEYYVYDEVDEETPAVGEEVVRCESKRGRTSTPV